MADQLHDLADLPPEELVAAADQLAKRLRAKGERDRAAEVKRLRKSTVPDWIVGQVRRHHADVVQELRSASLAVPRAQASLITTGDREGLRRAVATHQDTVQALVAVVDQDLARHGRPASYRDDAVSTTESDVTAEVASGSFGLPEDLQLPDRPALEAAEEHRRRLAGT